MKITVLKLRIAWCEIRARFWHRVGLWAKREQSRHTIKKMIEAMSKREYMGYDGEGHNAE